MTNHVRGCNRVIAVSLRIKHIATFFAWLERCCCVVIRAVRVWFCEDELEGDIAHSRSCAQCPFRPQARHSVFALSSLSRRRRSASDTCDGRTGYLPSLLPLPLPFPFSCPKEMQACTLTCSRIQFSGPHNSDIVQSNI